MQNGITPENSTSTRKYPTSLKVFGVLVLCGISSLLSTFSSLFLIFSAVIFAWVLTASKRSTFAVAVPIVTIGLLWIFTKDIFLSAIAGLAPFVIGLGAAFATRRKKSFWSGSVYCAVGYGIYSGVSFVYMLLKWSADKGVDTVLSAAALWWQEMTASASELFVKTLEASQLELEVTTDTLNQLVSGTAVLLPGTLSAVFLFLGAMTYLLCAVAHRALGTEEEFFSRRFNPIVGLHSAVFFIVTVLLAAISSAFKNAEVVQFAFINIAVAMFMPLLVTGFAIAIYKTKAVRQIATMKNPDGDPVAAPRRTFILWLIIPLIILNPFMGLTFVAFYGAVERINSEIFYHMKKKFGEKRGD